MASTWIKLHDDFFTHPKVIGLSPTTTTIYIRALCYSSQHLTDGRVPLKVIASWGYARWRHSLDTLSTCSLVTMSEECIQIHDYLDYQRSAEEARNIKEKRASAGAKGGKAKAAKAKQTPSKVLDGALAEKRREEPPSPPTVDTSEQPNDRAAYGGEDEIIIATARHMARYDLAQAKAGGTIIANERAWLAAALESRLNQHRDAIAFHLSGRDKGMHYALHVELSEVVDSRCGPSDGGAARAQARRLQAEALAAEEAKAAAEAKSDPAAVRAAAAAARAALAKPTTPEAA